ncbi:MAG: EamA family transporter [Pseudomonadota bacterium]|nr:EamA family transporter [Pseudomonadota bacterium]
MQSHDEQHCRFFPCITLTLLAELRYRHYFRVRLRLPHIVGIVLGFVGAAVLIGFKQLSLSYVGIGLALLGALCWAGYCVFRLKWKAPTARLLQRGFGLSAVFCAVLHFLGEHSALPGVGSGVAAVVTGIIPAALGNWTWDEGFRKGDSQLLAVMAYATPLCSAALLAVLGLESLTWNLFAGALLIMIAGLLSRADTQQ